MHRRMMCPALSKGVGLVILLCVASMLASSCATGSQGRRPGEAAQQPQISAAAETLREKFVPPEELKAKEKEFMIAQEEKPPRIPEKPETLKGVAEPNSLSNLMSSKVSVRPREKEEAGKPVHVELAFDNADLYEVLDATLFELFKVNYMVDPSIKAKVTFHVAGDFTRTQFINILNNVLQLNNLAITRGPGQILKVVRKTASSDVSNAPLLLKGEKGLVGDVTRLVKLRYMSAVTAAKNIRPFVTPGAALVPDTVTNSLIITDTPDSLEKAVGILSVMDVPYFMDVSWQLFPIKEVDSADVAQDLGKILKTAGLYNRPGAEQGTYEIFPIKTMNAILVVTRWPSMLRLVEEWVSLMDHADESGTAVFVYFVENGIATDLSDILKQLYGEKVEGPSKKVPIVEPTRRAPEKAGVAGELTGKVEIIPDETNNAIVFKASGRDYKIIREVLKQLDIVPRQVLINVVLAEVTLSGSLSWGVEWFLQGHKNGYTNQAILDQGESREIATPLGSTSGFSYAVFDGMDFLRGLVTALGSDSEVDIISSPNILAVDNKEAVIEIGQEIPTVTGQVTSATSGSTVTNTVQYRKTGVLLTVTPHINSSRLVKMELVQEFSEVGELVPELNNYKILNRRAQTSLVIQDGQTIVLAGLMSSNRKISDSGIPYLKDIPILGYLFGGKSNSLEKTELIMLITPRVVQTREEADRITRELSEKISRVKDLIEKKE
jgi:general secretion pathway protein D